MVDRDSFVDQPLSEFGETFRLQIVRTNRRAVEESGENIVSASVDAE